MQFDQNEKGFSFSKEGPLDMRMDKSDDLTAKKIVNSYSEEKLGTIIRDFGEEPRWRKAAKAIVNERRKNPFNTTTELAEFLGKVLGFHGRGRLHPATLVFQALRIAVNNELDSIEKGLKKAIGFLATGGRIGAISFHSLEDRIVKTVFKAVSDRKKKGPHPLMKLLTKKPLVPSFAEIRLNPRSRSAKMRFAEKL